MRKLIIILLLKLSRSNIYKYLKLINKYSEYNREMISALQNNKLNNILLHCYYNVPYYKKIFEEINLVKDWGIDIKQFSKIPVLTKDIIRENFENLKSKDINKRKWFYETSGGSTGEPVRFIQDKEFNEWNISNKIYYKTFVNQQVGDKELRLWGSEKDLLEGKEKLSIRLRNWLYNRIELNTFKMNDNDLYNFVEIWNKFKPSWIESYVQSIIELTNFIKKNDIKIYYPNGILTSAGVLYDDVRELIEDVFHCKVFNRYGSREIGDMACSCEKSNSLHLSIWNQYFEILDENLNPVKPGETGYIYVTTLNNYSMPLIRYKIGDMAEAEHNNNICHCGRETLMIKSIKGREVNLFKTKQGDKIDGEFFTHMFYFKDWIKKFQVIQKDYGVIDCIIVKNYDENKIDMLNIEKDIKIVMGENCKVNWEFVSDIPPLKSGKYLYTISEVK